MSITQSYVKTTSWAVTGSPSCQVAPGRSLKVHVSPSSLWVQLCASSGREPRSSARKPVRRSWVRCTITRSWGDWPRTGSTASGPPSQPTRSVTAAGDDDGEGEGEPETATGPSQRPSRTRGLGRQGDVDGRRARRRTRERTDRSAGHDGEQERADEDRGGAHHPSPPAPRRAGGAVGGRAASCRESPFPGAYASGDRLNARDERRNGARMRGRLEAHKSGARRRRRAGDQVTPRGPSAGCARACRRARASYSHSAWLLYMRAQPCEKSRGNRAAEQPRLVGAVDGDARPDAGRTWRRRPVRRRPA